jgi:DNA-binding NarL/FixJ family response regulator
LTFPLSADVVPAFYIRNMEQQIEQPYTIIIADDHQIFRDGFKLLLKKLKTENLQLLAEAENGQQLVDLVARYQPDIVITDIQMPVLDGIEATRQIKQLGGKTAVIALSMFNQDDQVLEMLHAGASGYLLKNTSKAELQKALNIVRRGGIYFSPETSAELTKTIRAASKPQVEKIKFTSREVDILYHMCKGLTNKEIGDQLHLSTRTVETHRQNLLEKTDTKNSVGLTIYAIKHGVIELDKI